MLLKEAGQKSEFTQKKGGGVPHSYFFYSTIYPTPLSILPFVTWVPQSKLAFGQTPRRASGPRPNRILQCAASLAATIGPAG